MVFAIAANQSPASAAPDREGPPETGHGFLDRRVAVHHLRNARQNGLAVVGGNEAILKKLSGAFQIPMPWQRFGRECEVFLEWGGHLEAVVRFILVVIRLARRRREKERRFDLLSLAPPTSPPQASIFVHRLDGTPGPEHPVAAQDDLTPHKR